MNIKDIQEAVREELAAGVLVDVVGEDIQARVRYARVPVEGETILLMGDV